MTKVYNRLHYIIMILRMNTEASVYREAMNV
jgi:hypothetical protein